MYTAQQWHKARQFAPPLAIGMSAVAHIILLLRIPGGLEAVGIAQRIGPTDKKRVRDQLNMDGEKVPAVTQLGYLLRR